MDNIIFQIRGNTVTLRKWESSDALSLAKHANNLMIAQFLTNMFPHPYTIDDAHKFIKHANTEGQHKIFAIIVEGEAVGGIGVHPQCDIFKYNAELGYWLSEDYWGKGIMSRCVREVIKYTWANMDINRIFARPFHTNIGSQKVLEKAGFELEARFNKTIFKNGEFLDELIYAVRK